MRPRLLLCLCVPLVVAGCSGQSDPSTTAATTAASSAGQAAATAAATEPGQPIPGQAADPAQPAPGSVPAAQPTEGTAPPAGQTPAAQQPGQPPGQQEATQSGNRYANVRFGFSLQVPDGLSEPTESDSGDGVTFSAGNGTLLVYGANNVLESPTRAFVETGVRESGGEVLSATGSDNDFTVVARLGTDTQRTRYLVGSKSHVVAQWLYPQAEASTWDAPAEQSLATLQASKLENVN